MFAIIFILECLSPKLLLHLNFPQKSAVCLPLSEGKPSSKKRRVHIMALGGLRYPLLLLLLLLLFMCLDNLPHGSCSTHPDDVNALKSLYNQWRNGPASWRHSSDPCNDEWEGVSCNNNNSRVTKLRLFNMRIEGTLSDAIGDLPELQIIDFSSSRYLVGQLPPSIGRLGKLQKLILIGCKFSGSIPDEIGNLSQLKILSLNSNHFSGRIPPSLGKLSHLEWLDLANNQLDGTLPTSETEGSGLDQLVNNLHIHLNNNNLSGQIPKSLFRADMKVIHILLDRNNLSGEIPESIGLLRKLEVLRLDNNFLNGSVPPININLTQLNVLNLANNKLTGPMPDMAGMHLLWNLDLSNNSFDPSEVPAWFSDPLKNLTTLVIESGGLKGNVPETLFSFPMLQEVRLSKNSFTGNIYMGSNFSKDLKLVDFQHNLLISVTISSNYKDTLLLVGNPICDNVHIKGTDYCQGPIQVLTTNFTDNMSCSFSYEVKSIFRAPYFSYTNAASYTPQLRDKITNVLKGAYNLSIPSYSFTAEEYLQIQLKFCPSTARCLSTKDILNTLDLNDEIDADNPLPQQFGPFYFAASEYQCREPKNKVLILALVIGFAAATIAVGGIGCYAVRQKRQAQLAINQSNPFASWGSNGDEEAGDAPHQKAVRYFSYDELKKFTKNFSNSQVIGAGGYGKVYKGILSGGQIVAIKRLQKNSLQGGLEFKTEIESLSRVHHKNLIELIGFCYEKGERILVYEYISNGTLSENLTGSRYIQLDWKTRIQIALDSATALAYLHEHANPPLIHRDIKPTNILLDDNLNAKVADFGLSKLVKEVEMGNVSTYVKGTWGYLDPEYFRTNKLTAKSDVFSFGVVMLEIITGGRLMRGGRHIVGEVENAVDRYDKEYYGLRELMDQVLLESQPESLVGFKRFIDLALRCTEMLAEERPTMDEVAKEIDMILKNLD